jgi:hypothetical protein
VAAPLPAALPRRTLVAPAAAWLAPALPGASSGRAALAVAAGLRAARADRLQTSLNLALRPAPATIGLTIPVVAVAAILPVSFAAYLFASIVP